MLMKLKIITPLDIFYVEDVSKIKDTIKSEMSKNIRR